MNYKTSSWTFSKEVSEKFESHVRQSVPLYDLIQSSIVHLSDYYLQHNKTIYDLGCATGETLHQIQERHQIKNVTMIGIDNSEHMIEKAKSKLKTSSNAELINADLESYQFPSQSNFILAVLTLQFLSLPIRKKVIERIYDALEEGGAFICVEKTLAETPTTQHLFTHIHYDIKQSSGLTYTDILLKEQSLRGVMTPISLKDNLAMFAELGFETDIFLKHWQFTGFICIKPYQKK